MGYLYLASTYSMNSRSLASYIDHTLLRPTATEHDIIALCDEALELGCFSVCVNGCWVSLTAQKLQGSSVKVCSVIGFPLGASSTSAKREEAQLALGDGAVELDMVMNIGFLKSGNYSRVKEEISEIRELAHSHHALLKVIIETPLLNQEEKEIATTLSCEAGANFVKTCTGFAAGSATIEDIKLMHSICAGRAMVKASGGIKDKLFAEQLLAAGASRLGTSSTRSILGGVESVQGY